VTTRTFLSIIARKRLLSRGDEEKARMNENIGWVVGGGRGSLFTPPDAFSTEVFTNIGRSAGEEGYYARNNSPCSVGFTLSLAGRNNSFQVYKNFNYFKNQLKYDKSVSYKECCIWTVMAV